MTRATLIRTTKRSILVTCLALAIPTASIASDPGDILLRAIASSNVDAIVKAFDDLTAAGSPVAKLFMARGKGDSEAEGKLKKHHGIEYREQNRISRGLEKLLYKGVERNDAETITKLAAFGVNLDKQQRDWENNYTALHFSAAHGFVEATTALFKAGADPDKVDRFGFTPLQVAMTDIGSGVAEALLEGGADPNKGHLYLPLHVAVEETSIELVQRLLEAEADPNIARPDRGWFRADKDATPLFIAVLNGSNKILDALLAGGADPNLPSKVYSPRSSTDRTPLPEAASKGNLAAVQSLLAAGADPNILVAKGTITPLSAAAASGNVEIISALLDGGAEPWVRNSKRQTALHSASTDKAVAVLVEGGIAVEVLDNRNNSPLVLAAERGNESAVKALLERGANVHGQGRVFNSTMPLFRAAKAGHSAVITILIEAGAFPNARNTGPKAEPMHQSPLHLASSGTHPYRADAVKALLEGGADPNLRVDYQVAPLHVAAVYGRLETVKALIDAGADPNATMAGGTTVLHAAAEGDEVRQARQVDVIRELIKRGADPKRQNDLGFTPRHIAAQQWNLEAAKILSRYQ